MHGCTCLNACTQQAKSMYTLQEKPKDFWLVVGVEDVVVVCLVHLITWDETNLGAN